MPTAVLLSGALGVAAVLGSVPAREAQAQPDVEVVAKRFLRTGGSTLVDGFCRIPLSLFQVLPMGESRSAAYRVSIAVRDSSGLLLHESDWSQTVAGQLLGLEGASTVEHFAFAVPDGSYGVTVTVVDSASGQVNRVTTEIEALEANPYASDLLVSTGMRRTSGEAAAPGELQKGSLFLVSTTLPVLTPSQSQLYYYLELYPGQDAAVELTARVLTMDEKSLIATAPEELQLGGAGGVAARGLSLAGLPPGDYRLQLSARFPKKTVVREAAFTMAGFDTEEALAAVAPETRRDPFAMLTRQQLDSVYWPLEYIMEGDERGIFETLSIEGRQNYLRQFWAKRDPTPGTTVNEQQIAYYQRVAEATRRYRESGAGDMPGWGTPRGRIFLKRGEPEEVLSRPEAGGNPPYEVWKFSRPRSLKYVFLDETGLGNYALIFTNDRFEISRSGWEGLLSPEALEDIRRF